MKIITIPTEGGDLVFRKPDDATAMRLLRSFMRIGQRPDDPTLHRAFWEALAPLSLAPVDRAFVRRQRSMLAPDDPVLTWSVPGHWIALHFHDSQWLAIAIELLSGIPLGVLGGTGN